MVYKRFIKKGGKVYGPYYYSSKKENGKVISQYHGKTESSVKNSYKKFFLLGFFVFFLTASFFFVNYGLTGKASLDIESKYVEGEKIKGNLKFSLKQGELIPVDSKVVIHLGDEAQEYFLSELVDLNFTSGNFHAEGVTIPGEGIGYGLIGKKKIYPEVSFDLRIFEKEVEEASEQETDEEEISEEVDENEVNETEEEDEVESEEESAEEEGEEVESSLITGEVIAESYEIVSGTVGRENNFVYEYEKGKMVELVPGSVSVDGIIIDDGAVNVKSENKKVIVSTSYYHEEEGFGEEYLKNNELKLDMGFEQFDLVVQNDSELVVLLVYEGIILAEASEVLSVVSEVVEEPEVGEEPEEIEEGPEVVMDETIIFVVENFTAEFNISTIQYGAVLNKNVKWKKSIKTTDAIDLRVQIPKNAENIAVYKLNEVLEEVEESNESLDEPAVGENLIKIINETASEKNVTGVVNETSNESIGNETTEISSTSEDDETNVIVVNQTNVSIGNKVVLEEKVEEEIEKEKQNSKITAEVISGEILAEIDLAESSSFFSFFGKIFKSLTGRSIVVEETEEVKEIIINENATEFEIEYETPGPVAIEENTGFGKSVIVSSKVHYENILAYSELPRSVPESKVKLYHIVNGSRVEVDFVGYSVDETAINDTLVSELTKEKNQTDVHQANKSSAVFGITGNVVEKSLNEEIIPSLPLTEIIETTSQNDSDQSLDETSVSAISETESSASNADGSVTIISGNATVDGIVSDEIPVIVEAKINKTNTEKLLNKTPKKMISYIEWVVPHLSDQTYEIVIEISNAEHLDENRIFIENIYGEVKAKDDVWSDEIKDRRYVRVTFEKNLTVENDITVYARDAGLFGSSNIEIYLEGRDEIITTIENIGDEGWYKTYLTNMTEEGYGTFDLRIDGGIEFDFIVDPQRFDTACANFTGTYYHTGCNDGNITLSIDNSTTNYYSQGNYTSNAFDAGMTVSWDNVSWSAIIPSLGKNYFGDGSDGAVTISSNTELNIINNGGDYDGDMVVRNYNSLVIADGITLTTNDSGRGLLIYVEGNVVINGTLSMTARGAKANPANDNDGDGTTVGANGVRIGMFKSGETDTLASAEFNGTGTAARAAVANQPAISENGKVFTIARAGANGGAGGVPVNSGSSGSNGGAGQSGGGGGGGSDAARNSGGDGTAGTVFSGGTGGGGTG
ncbi:hypothetical protein CMI44_00235, partial [Candidatus Pacearchaeota archaeon]|nr:hypothetical protein [Candidatus Pacearchaeota archaeon]